MKEHKQLKVIYRGIQAGTLAVNPQGKVAFQYCEDWINNGFSISPFSLPLSDQVYVPSTYNFEGLFGVFADSLPDSWGRLVFDRMLSANGIAPASLGALDRLAVIGSSGMGALEYVPEYKLPISNEGMSLDELAEECEKLFESRSSERLDELFARCGSSGGARPKAYLSLDGEEWIVKFQYSYDEPDSGLKEFNYSIWAKECGINMPETKLLPSEKGKGYFACKRFDRPKRHMISASALLEKAHDRSFTDYQELFKLTNIITNGNKEDRADLFRRMCFNVFFENQDDHLKNFSYLYDDEKSIWRLSPAYDMTHSVTAYKEHTTTVNGKGKNITSDDLLAVGRKAGLQSVFCKETIDKISSLKNTVIFD